jgi:hypothetical protein
MCTEMYRERRRTEQAWPSVQAAYMWASMRLCRRIVVTPWRNNLLYRNDLKVRVSSGHDMKLGRFQLGKTDGRGFAAG